MKSDRIYLFIFILLYSIVFSFLNEVSLIGSFFAGIFLYICFSKNINYYDKKGLVIYFLILIIDTILLLYGSKYKNLPLAGVDVSNFDYFAKYSLIDNDGNIIKVLFNSQDLFCAIIAILYKLFGTNVTLIYFFILPVTFIKSNYMYKILFRITGSIKIARLYSLIILLYPANIIFGVSVLRETYIQCLVIMSFYWFYLYLEDSKITYFVKSIVFILLALFMHNGVIGVLIVYLYIFIQKRFFKKVKIFRPGMIIITAILLFVFSFTPLWGTITKKFNNIDSASSFVNTINVQQDYLKANTQYIKSVPNNFGELLLTAPYRVIMYLIAPFPWQVYSLETIFSLIMDALFRYYIVFNLFIIFKNRKKYSAKYQTIINVVFLTLIITDIIFAFGCNNYGQAMRHRTKLLTLELILLALKDQNTNDNKSLIVE